MAAVHPVACTRAQCSERSYVHTGDAIAREEPGGKVTNRNGKRSDAMEERERGRSCGGGVEALSPELPYLY